MNHCYYRLEFFCIYRLSMYLSTECGSHYECRWGARVLYGDTDSMFIYLEGRSLKQAFDIGNEIVNNISAMNPWYGCFVMSGY